MFPKLFKHAASFLVFANLSFLHAQAPIPDSPAVEQRVAKLLGQLSMQEKIRLIGQNGLYTYAEPKIGLPPLKASDGPVGVRTWGPSTAFAAGIALAASWDPPLAEQVGESLGRDARARGVHFLLGPGVDIYRAPMCGRNFEYLGEDPFLAGRMAVSYIEGVQSQGVSATVKHFAANNSEFDRHNLNTIVDERTLREIYLPAFEAAVREGHVGAVMDSYNLVNGEHSTQNRHLNVDILKKDWGFDGILMSDYGATYDGVAAANAGLDLENPTGQFMNAKTLLPAIAEGRVSVAVIDDKVRRILRTAIRFGFLDRDQTDLNIPLYRQRGRQVALEEALESLVLLKNAGNLLPLDSSRIRTIAVIGPDAWPAVPGGGGSSQTTPFAATSFLDGISDWLGSKAKVLYAPGLPTLDELCDETRFEGGLKEEIFGNTGFRGAPISSDLMQGLNNFRVTLGSNPAARMRSIRWSGSYLPQKSGKYLFLASAEGVNSYRLFVDGKPLLQETLHENQFPHSSEMALEAGKRIMIRLDYVPSSSGNVSLGIRAVDDLINPDALKLAATADAALVAVGFDPVTEGESFDRSFEPPWGQEHLIRFVAAANARTIVSITSGGGVAMGNWIGKVPAVLQNWYPGQEGGTALAQILFGERSPEGKLPISIEMDWKQNPVHDTYYPEGSSSEGNSTVRDSGGVFFPAQNSTEVHPTVRYSEGVFLGYRYYTTRGIEPRFPFGFGLSYTSFTFDHLKVLLDQSTADIPVTVSFDVTNTGKHAGAEVAQLYLGDPSARVERPLKELKGFEKVRLEPGQSKHVTLRLDRRSLSYWSEKDHDWRVDPGRFIVFVGDSSENTPLSAQFTWSGPALASGSSK